MEKNNLKSREEMDSMYKWQIEKIYASIADWENDFNKLKEIVPNITKYEGKLHIGQNLLSYFKLYEEILRLGEKLAVFAHCRSDEDTTNTTFQSLKSKIDTFFPVILANTSFFIPEILSIPKNELLEEIQKVEELKIYTFLIEDILNLKPHTLSKEEENIMASVSECLESPGNIYSMLSNADITFPKIKDENDEEIELTDKNYSVYISSKDRRVREIAFKALFNTYNKYKNTFAISLTSSIKNFIFNSKIRKFNSSLESSLKPNNIPIEVYNKTIETINNNLSSLHRYVNLKKKLLKLDEMHMYDLYVPIVSTPNVHIEFNEAIKIVENGLNPLGPEYLSIFREGIENGWIDIFENRGKRGGAYSSGSYDTMPYILLNYNYKLNDVSTLAHEMGHSIHSYYSKKYQPYIYSNYTLFCAEVASTTNECLLINHLINIEKDKNKKLYFINQQLEQIRTTVFRQVMFAEFEKSTHEKLENGIPLTSEDLCNIWHELNVKYFGKDIVIDKEIDIEWARIPHFYSDFYVYQYATGYAAANSFANKILNGEDKALEKYLGFLKSGGSDYPINILKKAGVDMTTSKPIEDTIKRFDELLNMMENTI
ncbi:oligoendopeptidase F [Clostridium tetanomorphum]|uniref:Oligopeptidase F n=1 Tax=Clostridium tetanomorphum TaxID=1553 RepID=A0A923EDA9_CLOTT|nr:oligoendopeptidase F [Clostridium tetanomorphum]MBC2399059.1 oligoendopeptidase F [Clostridium tetanomorphum]NRZ98600.1 oligoendopeptidase F [Clostridium tetanomorphum]